MVYDILKNSLCLILNKTLCLSQRFTLSDFVNDGKYQVIKTKFLSTLEAFDIIQSEYKTDSILLLVSKFVNTYPISDLKEASINIENTPDQVVGSSNHNSNKVLMSWFYNHSENSQCKGTHNDIKANTSDWFYNHGDSFAVTLKSWIMVNK